MLIWSTLPLVILSTSVAAKSSDATSRWSTLAAKNGGLIKLTSRTFDELTSGSRNFSVSVTLTALNPQFRCQPCRYFDAETRMLAKGWSKHPRRDDHLFAVLDFPDGRDIFQRMNLNTAPHTRLYLPTEGPRASAGVDAESYDIVRNGADAEPFAAWLRTHTELPITFRRPPNYGLIISTIASLVIIGIATWRFWPYVSAILLGKHVWALGTTFFIILMNAGYMWNQIRHPPYAMPRQDGGVNYIANGYQNQFAAETQIVTALYAVLAFSVYTLAVTVPWILDPWRQRVAVYIWAGVLLFLASILMSLFRAKSPGYPFAFLPFI